MKQRIIYSILSITLLLVSCDSFLDIQPVGQVIPNNVEEYRALLAKAYKTVPGNRGLASLRSDEMKVSNTEWDQNAYGYLERWDDMSPLTSNVPFSWANYYQVIFTANEIINNRSTIVFTHKEEVDQLVGEAYLLRAYMHFNLVNLHGQPYTKEGALSTKSIPLRLNNDLEASVYRNTVEEVYSSICTDITNAKELLNVKEWEKKYSYRFTTYAANALSARVSLYMGNWVVAYEESMKLINNPLFNLENLTSESATLPNHYLSQEAITSLELVFNSALNKATEVSSLLYNKYQEGDYRQHLYFSEPNEEGIIKSQKGGSNEFTSTFRLAEFYLTAAEALTQLNKLEEAKELLLQLMQNRLTNELYSTEKEKLLNLSQGDLILEIAEERARELAFEGHRWFDLRRTTRPRIEKTLKVGNEDKTYILEKDDARYTIPIPNAAIQSNPNLTK
ncbi:MAG: RagB/SusD family nutrient uptake outer membrane protein [Bacteroides sp.]|nr:RagB/SusD family nutrient uptake outer membrane protein [Bacteroides sp.]MDD4720621.1 RagB/SusD family nutrient uptake outer membrane protein [Bacteroides sp.]